MAHLAHHQLPKVRSRITVALHYEALGFAGRESVWRNLLKIPGGISACFVAIVLVVPGDLLTFFKRCEKVDFQMQL